jgi:hypothetical protein
MQQFLLPVVGGLFILLVLAVLYFWWSSAPAPSEQAGNIDGPAAPAQPQALLMWRDPQDGKLTVEFSGRSYRSLAEVIEPEIRDQILAMFGLVSQFTGDMLASTFPSQAPMQTPASAASISRLAAGGPTEITADVATADVSGMLGQLSMADQIEDILQKLLAQRPAMADRSIHIRSAIDGGVRIEVDGHSYNGVADIGDDEARAVIQAAIQEWESRSS